ncbi:hypothetical protein CRJUMX01_1840003 [Escherichia coli]|nr:hypothetical protein CRJUMX01_1840003 [Escherichia coli]
MIQSKRSKHENVTDKYISIYSSINYYSSIKRF